MGSAYGVYIGANIGLALQDNYAALLILRCLQGTGSSGTVALGSGVVVDIASSGERGTFIGKFVSRSSLNTSLISCRRFSTRTNGRSGNSTCYRRYLGRVSTLAMALWFLTISAVVFLIPLALTFPETGFNVVGNGSLPPQSWNMSLLNYLHNRSIEYIDVLSRTQSRQEKKAAQAEIARRRH